MTGKLNFPNFITISDASETWIHYYRLKKCPCCASSSIKSRQAPSQDFTACLALPYQPFSARQEALLIPLKRLRLSLLFKNSDFHTWNLVSYNFHNQYIYTNQYKAPLIRSTRNNSSYSPIAYRCSPFCAARPAEDWLGHFHHSLFLLAHLAS